MLFDRLCKLKTMVVSRTKIGLSAHCQAFLFAKSLAYSLTVNKLGIGTLQKWIQKGDFLKEYYL